MEIDLNLELVHVTNVVLKLNSTENEIKFILSLSIALLNSELD